MRIHDYRALLEEETITEISSRQISLLHYDYESGVCAYCGQLASTNDYLLPVDWKTKNHFIIPVVPACEECAEILSEVTINDVVKRREVVHAQLRYRYSDNLNTVLYGESDLEEFGEGLRGFLVRGMMTHEILMERLEWPGDSIYDVKAQSEAWEEEPILAYSLVQEDSSPPLM